MEAILQEILAEIKSLKSEVETIKAGQARLEDRISNLEHHLGKLGVSQENIQAELKEIGKKAAVKKEQTTGASEHKAYRKSWEM